MTSAAPYTPRKTAISSEESDRRRKSWEQANASVLIEGGSVSAETRVMQERHISGEITRDEYRAWLKGRHNRT